MAQRLVEAAKRAGADAADAVAVRGVSQGVEVRDGRVEESERSEGDDVGLRVLVGQRQAVVSTNDVSGDGIAKLAERAVAMARVAPDDKYVGLADPALLARDFPDLDLLDRNVPSTSELERRALEAEAAALAVKGVTKSGGASASTGIGGMVLVTSTGFHGSYLRSSQGISMTAISGDGTGMERDYDFTIGAACVRSRLARKRRPQGGRARGGAHQSAQGRDLQGAGGVRSPRLGIAGRPSRRRGERRLDRAQDQFPEGPSRRAAVCQEHPHHRRSAARARLALAGLRRRGRQGQEDSPSSTRAC